MARVARERAYLDFRSPFDVQIAESLCELFDFDDGSADKADFAVELFRCLNRLIEAGNIRGVGRDYDLASSFTHRFFKILAEHHLRGGKPGPVSAKTIGKKGRDALLCGLRYFEELRPFLVRRGQVEFVVCSVVEIADRCFYEQVGGIRDGVRDMDKRNGEITDMQVPIRKWNRLDDRLGIEFS